MKETIVILNYIDKEKVIEKQVTKIVFHGDKKFSAKELEEIIGSKINDNVILIPEFIFLDDTIRSVKQKLFNYLNNNSKFKKKSLIIEEILL